MNYVAKGGLGIIRKSNTLIQNLNVISEYSFIYVSILLIFFTEV